MILKRSAARDEQWHEEVCAFRKNLVEYEAGGQTIHYVDIPPHNRSGSADSVVLVHGYADSTYSWHANLAAFVDSGLRVVAIDQPGLGRSSIPGPRYRFGIENQAAAVMRVIEALELQRVRLVGHSMGAGIVLYLCLHHPELFERAVAIAPVTRVPRKSFVLTWPGAVTAARLLGRLAFAHALRDVYADSSRVTAALVNEYARPAARPGYWQALRRLSVEYFSPAFVNLTERLSEIEAEVLLLWGAQDSWVRPRPAVAEMMPHARFEQVAGAAHNVHQECAPEVNSAVLAFLQP